MDMLPDEVKAIRIKYGLSQSELGDLVGVTKICISNWERGLRRVPQMFVKLHRYALLAWEQDILSTDGRRFRTGRPKSTETLEREAKKATDIELYRPILCSIRFADPVTGELYDPLAFRPYEVENMETDGRRRPDKRYILITGQREWSQVAWHMLEDQLRGQLRLAGHSEARAEAYQVERGASWSWHKVETSRPLCEVRAS